jgi:long-subunit fatty acid transport protein
VDQAWPAEGAQRYAVITSQVRQLFVGPSVAQAITPWFVVGAGLQYTTLSVKQTFTATLCNVDEPESCGSDNPSDDVGLAVDVADPGRITGNIGVLVRPRPWLTIGASAQPAVAYAASGTVTSTISDDNSTVRPVLTGSTFADADATLLVTLPWTVRFGAEARIGARARVEVDGTWTGWSTTDALTVTDLDLALETLPEGPLHGESIVVSDDVSLPTGFVDSWSVRVGGDVALIPALTLRAGVYGETGATPDRTASVAAVDADKVGAALGLTAHLGPHLVVDASGSFTGFADRTVTASGYAQTALDVDYQNDFHTTTGAGRIVGNGRYTATAWVAGVGVGWEFGAAGGR